MTAPELAPPLAFRLRDLTDRAPQSYVMRPRRIAEIRAVVLHQTGFDTWRESNPMWAKVRAHFVVHRSGLVSQLHPITARMRFGCGRGNAWAINIEHEGNYPLGWDEDGEDVYYRPEKFGRSRIEDAPEQITAGRALLAYLHEQIPSLMVGAHRQVDDLKGGCCGPDIWREIGQFAIDSLGMAEMPVAGGLPIPDRWRTSSAAVLPTNREYEGPLVT